MFITLLYLAAFIYFIAGRKIRYSSLAGIGVILLASLVFSRRILYEGFRLSRFIEQHYPDIEKYSRNHVTIVFSVFISLILIAVLMIIGKLWSRDLFRPSCEGIRASKRAKKLFIAASVITGVVALQLSLFSCVLYISRQINFPTYVFILFDNIGVEFLFLRRSSNIRSKELQDTLRIASTVYVVLLLAISILCIILINRKNVSYKMLPALKNSKEPSDKAFLHGLPLFAITFSLSGLLTFLTVAQTGYYYWARTYGRGITEMPVYYSIYFGSYNAREGQFQDRFQYIFALSLLFVLAVSACVLLISLIKMAVRKMIRQYLFSFIFSVLLFIVSPACIYHMIANALKFYSIGR